MQDKRVWRPQQSDKEGTTLQERETRDRREDGATWSMSGMLLGWAHGAFSPKLCMENPKQGKSARSREEQ